MRHARLLLLFALLSSLVFPATARQSQTASEQSSSAPAVPIRNAAAIALLQQTLSLMGGGNLAQVQDTYAETRIATPGDQSVPQAIVSGRIFTLGFDKVRIEIDTSSGTRKIISNGQNAWIVEPNESHEHVTQRSISPVGITYLPHVALAEDLADASTDIEDVGSEVLGATAVRHIRISRHEKFFARAELNTTTYDVFVDSSSGLIAQIHYLRRAPANLLITVPVQVAFDDYRNVNGLTVPFSITERVRGELLVQYQNHQVPGKPQRDTGRLRGWELT